MAGAEVNKPNLARTPVSLPCCVVSCRVVTLSSLVVIGFPPLSLALTRWRPLAQFGDFPLHVACSETARAGIAEVLIRAGADVNARDARGRTPLHRAAAWVAGGGRSATPQHPGGGFYEIVPTDGNESDRLAYASPAFCEESQTLTILALVRLQADVNATDMVRS